MGYRTIEEKKREYSLVAKIYKSRPGHKTVAIYQLRAPLSEYLSTSVNMGLGLSHDGDRKNGNDCGDEALEGSVMAPMVAATFSKFSWSQCSKREFRKKM
ncbi:hypothetical protein NQ317_010538 [Molorchus minor]|uniref:Uncharacterized protein n=1 Tax=Molorchus minor TaxID=1323400 RepID=A0ABQ9K116_9CUCU|nr:hypothetical protein NQ317_010538 [Molorchus minor]